MKTPVTTLKWLIQREFWEHKGAFVWAPVILSGVMIFFLFLTLGIGNNLQNFELHVAQQGADADQTAAETVHIGGTVPVTLIEKGAVTVGNNYMWFSAPIFMMLAFVIFFYCLNTLYDERRDRSILFWKSLPISDTMTVASKVAVAMVAVPLVTVAIGFITSLVALLMGCIALSMRGINIFSLVFTTPAVYLAPFEVLGMLPLYLLWALPTIGWLLMVSSWARSKVFLWAVGVPVLSIVLLGWAEKMFGFGWDVSWYVKNIVGRLLLSVFPGGWLHVAVGDSGRAFSMQHSGMELGSLFQNSWLALRTFELWAGVVAGIIMICVAVFMRRWREDN